MEFELGYQDCICYDIVSSFETKEPGDLAACPMCSSALEKVTSTEKSPRGQEFRQSGMIPFVYTDLFSCGLCNWWAIRELGRDYELFNPRQYDLLATGALKKWDLSSKDIPVSILREYFEKNGRSIELRTIDPHVFEKLIAACLRYEYAPCEVHHVGARGGRGDGGIDIYLIKEELEWLIQVKRRLTEQPEPIETIRLLNGVLLREGKHHGMVVTSASSFTKNASSEITIRTPGAYCVKLFNRGDILNMMSKIPRDEINPWRKALADRDYWNNPSKLSEEFASLFLK